ncbi:MAG: hypothetical protein LPK79_05610 [Bacteroidota bacterium]|nr:hypothetical protein [Bacteroidota bacterium]MDX5447243.1 hypothetical protein [Bacteroidota bacterium]
MIRHDILPDFGEHGKDRNEWVRVLDGSQKHSETGKPEGITRPNCF